MPGNCWRNWATCAGLNIWWTEQWPFQSRIREPSMACSGVAAEGPARIPDEHLLERNSHGPGRVPAQVLVREKEGPAAVGQGPFQDGPRIGTGADDAAVAAAKSLQVGGRIDVGHRHQVTGIDDLAEVGPCGLHRVQRRPCRPCCNRRTCRAGNLTSGRDRISAVSAMKWTPQKTMDRQFWLAGRKLAELEAVSSHIGVANDLVLLIVVSQDQQRISQVPFHLARFFAPDRNRTDAGKSRSAGEKRRLA